MYDKSNQSVSFDICGPYHLGYMVMGLIPVKSNLNFFIDKKQKEELAR